MKRSTIRKMILNELLSEQAQNVEDGVSSPGLDFGSIDQQVDAFILKFEKDSIQNNPDDQVLAESFSELSLMSLLSEQEAEEVEAEEVDVEEEKEDSSPSEPASDDDLKDVPPMPEAPKPPLNIDEFTRRVARLAMNYQNLIDIKGSIVERSLRFLKENYDLEHANQMVDLLNQQFDFEIGDQELPTDGPYAVGAYDGGTGGGGGGV